MYSQMDYIPIYMMLYMKCPREGPVDGSSSGWGSEGAGGCVPGEGGYMFTLHVKSFPGYNLLPLACCLSLSEPYRTGT